MVKEGTSARVCSKNLEKKSQGNTRTDSRERRKLLNKKKEIRREKRKKKEREGEEA